ncbi:hypothetical protein E2C01_034601 [Portunus trituberculatus]|uniref:Uncharacterized protein n=1 Tax=Portunus trituberculatus TaxID=210409 RepID=A0A5B7F396_PORTR|nr:hypothetical protein [Portunus trituberculatus]
MSRTLVLSPAGTQGRPVQIVHMPSPKQTRTLPCPAHSAIIISIIININFNDFTTQQLYRLLIPEKDNEMFEKSDMVSQYLICE